MQTVRRLQLLSSSNKAVLYGPNYTTFAFCWKDPFAGNRRLEAESGGDDLVVPLAMGVVAWLLG